MENLEYRNLPSEEIDRIGPLWEKLRRHHVERAPVFKSHFNETDWEKRVKELLEKEKLEIWTAVENARIAGYCVASIDGKGKGEIDSLYIEPVVRGKGVGAELFRKCIEWLEREGAENITIYVAIGNEEVLPFYEKFGYAPRTYLLKKKPRI